MFLSLLEKEIAVEQIDKYEIRDGAICHKNKCWAGKASFLEEQAKKFEAEGIADYEFHDPLLCYSESQQLEMARAVARLKEFYDKAYLILDNAEQKQRVIAYLKKHAREYELRDSNSESGGGFLIVYSKSKEHYRKTQQVLACLKRGGDC